MERVILHSDLNNCYASIECMLHPELRGKYIAVCGSTEERHGIVLAKNQLAKQCGVKTGDVIWEARQKCPQLTIVPPHMDQYVDRTDAVEIIQHNFKIRSTLSTVVGSAPLWIFAATPPAWILTAIWQLLFVVMTGVTSANCSSCCA